MLAAGSQALSVQLGGGAYFHRFTLAVPSSWAGAGWGAAPLVTGLQARNTDILLGTLAPSAYCTIGLYQFPAACKQLGMR